MAPVLGAGDTARGGRKGPCLPVRRLGGSGDQLKICQLQNSGQWLMGALGGVACVAVGTKQGRLPGPLKEVWPA